MIAHSKNDRGVRHDLVDHLRTVAHLASDYASAFGASELASYIGLWHDLGKFHPDFQQYLRDVEKPDNKRRRGPDHKAAGARIAREHNLDPLAILLQGHHGGLKDRNGFLEWYQRCVEETDKALAPARATLDFDPDEPLSVPQFTTQNPLAAEFFLRMLFSTLVDADFLDTEAHFNVERGEKRGHDHTISELWRRFEEDQRQFDSNNVPDTVVNRSRREIYQSCLDAAELPPGLFRLTVPTGGGKTRSGMAFALRHALEHGQHRVIVAVPFITITQQTASTYRDIFDRAEDSQPAVLEHHSGVSADKEADDYDPANVWSRIAAENWDAPIIVTTTVQLFESLFANGTSRCRKLHRLANSVIILDEAQSLPPHLLDPILDALRELCAHYNSTVVLSTATQPAFESIPPFRDLDAREIIPNPEHYFQTLKRVTYDWRVDTVHSWDDVAALMQDELQAMAICNTKKDALALLDVLGDPEALHLSTLLCGAHRKYVIDNLLERLANGEPCRLVATQVVEAGVDIDFPLVLRALGPLDSIVQAGGRANREGNLDEGQVIVFKPIDGGSPPGAYARATNTTQTMLNSGTLDMHDPATLERYFKKWYQLEDTDRKKIQEKRKRLDYPEVSRCFRMIDDNTISVVITSYGTDTEQQTVRKIIDALRAGAPPTRDRMRKLQPYMVSLWQHQADKYMQQGLLAPQDSDGLAPGVWEWMGEYDEVRGLTVINLNPDTLVY